MTRIEILEKINQYFIDSDIKPLISLLNELLEDKINIDNNIDLIMMIIDSTQLYGYLKYIEEDIQGTITNESLILKRDTYAGRQFKYLNFGQLSLLNEFDMANKILVSAPTSFGKTSLVNEYIIKNNETLMNVLYVVPTNSLIEELFQKVLKFNKEFSLNYEVKTRPTLNNLSKNILILTPERFLMLLEKHNIDSFDLIVMDETYKIINYNDSRISDVINDRSFKFRKVLDLIARANTKSIFLSPFTYRLTSSMNDFVQKFNIKVVNRKIEYVNHTLSLLCTQVDVKNYFDLESTSFLSNHNISQKTSYLLKHLVDTKNIVYVSGYKKAYEITELMDYIEINNYSDRTQIFLNHLIDKYSTDNLDIWKIIEGLRKGTGIYISPIPRYIKKEIVNLYNNGEINNLIVTTSFVEGINTDARNIIITSKYTAQNQALSEIDLLNISGRAGRFGEHPIGTIITINNDVNDKLENILGSEVYLSNPNYEESDIVRDDYEIDMIENAYLNDSEKQRKLIIQNAQEKIGLTDEELSKSLNVSKLWKIILYDYFNSRTSSEILECSTKINNLINDEPGEVSSSLEHIFKQIKSAFDLVNINPFPNPVYSIPPFSSSGTFVWGILYRMHSYASTKEILNSKKNTLLRIKEGFNNSPQYNFIDAYLESNNLLWSKEYFNSNNEIDDAKIYTETFKFISNIMQFKIPFYINYFVSIFELFIEKNKKIDYKISEVTLNLDSLEIANYFENGNLEDDYQEMYDFGLPLEMIKKIQSWEGSISDLLKIEETILDNYEKIILSEYLNIFN